MRPRRKLIGIAIGSFVAGGLLIGTVATALFNRILNDLLRGNYIASFYDKAVDAQFDVRSLASLRSGNVDRVVSGLEQRLNAHTLYLAGYEDGVPPARRLAFVYRVLAEVRAYRENSPARLDYPAQEAAYEKALALGEKAGR